MPDTVTLSNTRRDRESPPIAWIAYRLASIHDEENNPIFNSVIVVTNRVVLDSQLQDTINSFEHLPGLVEAIDDKKRSEVWRMPSTTKANYHLYYSKFLFAYKDLDKSKAASLPLSLMRLIKVKVVKVQGRFVGL